MTLITPLAGPCQFPGCGEVATHDVSIRGRSVGRYCTHHAESYASALETLRERTKHKRSPGVDNSPG